MRVEKFSVEKTEKVSEAIIKRYPTLSYNSIRKLLRQKDVKINGKRISADIVLSQNDEVVFYIKEIMEQNLEVVYDDENVIIVLKNRMIETVSEVGDVDLLSKVEQFLNQKCYAVHRLDRNTEGFVVFAKNDIAKKSLDFAFKNRTIEKFYLALVYGVFDKKSDSMVAYLKKIADKSFVEISDIYKPGYEKIQTNYKVLKEKDDLSLIEVELVTGKTHQIRAHFAHVGHFVIGDEKYGISKINKILKKKYQCLCAYKMIFHFNENDCLSYLNEKVFELQKNRIDFCQKL